MRTGIGIAIVVAWPDLVGRRDVPVGPRGQRGNEVAAVIEP